MPFLYQKQKGTQLAFKDMEIIKRLSHDATAMVDAYLGWDIFKCADYSKVDRGEANVPEPGHTIVIAVNIGPIKFFKRLFVGF